MLSRTTSVEENDRVSVHRTAGFTFRHSRLASSLSSLYKNYDCHLDIVKLTAVLVLLSIISATLAITNNLDVCKSLNNTSDCIKLTTQPVDKNHLNSTLCSYITQYELAENYFVTVCLYQKEVRIDFRQFINGQPTIKGLNFSVVQETFKKC